LPQVSGVGHGRLIASNVLTRLCRRHSAAWAVASLMITGAGTVGAIVLLMSVGDVSPDVRSGLIAVPFTVVPYGLAGSILISRRPDLPFGWLLSGAAAALVIALAAIAPSWIAISHGYSGPLALWGLSLGSLGIVPVAVQGLINVRFPSGKPATRRGRALELAMIVGLCATVLGGILGTSTRRDMLPASAPPELRRSLSGTLVGGIADALAPFGPLVILLGLIAGIGVVVRCWRATGIERQQLKWRAAGVVVGLALFPLAVTEHLGAVSNYLDGSLFVATLAIPVLRYRLWAIDTIIRRSAVYATVTVVLVGCYVLITAVVAGMVPERVAASIAAVGVALAVLPIRSLIQRLVDRLFYGQRNDPYRALSDVGHRLDAVAASGGVLLAVVEAVASSLRLPYVAIERPDDGSVLASWGDADPAANAGAERWPLTFQGTPVGSLVAAPRRGETAFDARDRRVLADIARQAGPAVRAEALTADLLDSRQRLVTAREEERRRLRRDLHDGLGPMLTGLGLNLDAARAQLAGALRTHTADEAEIARIDEFLARAKEASSQVIMDLRGMAYELRPPALDDLGLVGAVRVHAERLATGGDMTVDIDAAGLPDLPAAVEVAAFRTAVEAIANAVRHGGARTCSVRLTASARELTLEVSDDGRSPASWQPGVGLTAMRERAEELGGTLAAAPSSTGGRVMARYPLSPTVAGVNAAPGDSSPDTAPTPGIDELSVVER
jgi:signal transduction histidine kinase